MNRRETANDIRAMVGHNQQHGNVRGRMRGVFGGYCAEGSARALGMSRRRRRDISKAVIGHGGGMTDPSTGVFVPYDHIGVNDTARSAREGHRTLMRIADRLDGGRGRRGRARDRGRDREPVALRSKTKNAVGAEPSLLSLLLPGMPQPKSAKIPAPPATGTASTSNPLAMLGIALLVLFGIGSGVQVAAAVWEFLSVVAEIVVTTVTVVALGAIAVMIALVLYTVATEAVNWEYINTWRDARRNHRATIASRRAEVFEQCGLDELGQRQPIALGPPRPSEMDETLKRQWLGSTPGPEPVRVTTRKGSARG